MDDNKVIIRCPFCGSSDLVSTTKGFSVSKAVVGSFLIGPIGLIGGAINSNKIKLTCLECNKSFGVKDAISDDSGLSNEEIRTIHTSSLPLSLNIMVFLFVLIIGMAILFIIL